MKCRNFVDVQLENLGHEGVRGLCHIGVFILCLLRSSSMESISTE
jgi:hypothetical protein